MLISSFDFQSESPSTSKLNNLGVYLLVSLYFVVAALLEFAVVLLVQRNLDAKLEGTGCRQIEKSARNGKQKVSNISPMNENAEYKMFEPRPEETNPQDKSNGKVMRLDSIQLSTDNIDTMACILFIVFYALFNLFYWM